MTDKGGVVVAPLYPCPISPHSNNNSTTDSAHIRNQLVTTCSLGGIPRKATLGNGWAKNGVGVCLPTLWPSEHSLPWMASNDRVWRGYALAICVFNHLLRRFFFAMGGYWFSPQSTPHRGVSWGLNPNLCSLNGNRPREDSWTERKEEKEDAHPRPLQACQGTLRSGWGGCWGVI